MKLQNNRIKITWLDPLFIMYVGKGEGTGSGVAMERVGEGLGRMIAPGCRSLKLRITP